MKNSKKHLIETAEDPSIKYKIITELSKTDKDFSNILQVLSTYGAKYGVSLSSPEDLADILACNELTSIARTKNWVMNIGFLYSCLLMLFDKIKDTQFTVGDISYTVKSLNIKNWGGQWPIIYFEKIERPAALSGAIITKTSQAGLCIAVSNNEMSRSLYTDHRDNFLDIHVILSLQALTGRSKVSKVGFPLGKLNASTIQWAVEQLGL